MSKKKPISKAEMLESLSRIKKVKLDGEKLKLLEDIPVTTTVSPTKELLKEFKSVGATVRFPAEDEIVFLKFKKGLLLSAKDRRIKGDKIARGHKMSFEFKKDKEGFYIIRKT